MSLVQQVCDNCNKPFDIPIDDLNHRHRKSTRQVPFIYCSQFCRSELYHKMDARKDVMQAIESDNQKNMGITIKRLYKLGFTVKIGWGTTDD